MDTASVVTAAGAPACAHARARPDGCRPPDRSPGCARTRPPWRSPGRGLRARQRLPQHAGRAVGPPCSTNGSSGSRPVRAPRGTHCIVRTSRPSRRCSAGPARPGARAGLTVAAPAVRWASPGVRRRDGRLQEARGTGGARPPGSTASRRSGRGGRPVIATTTRRSSAWRGRWCPPGPPSSSWAAGRATCWRRCAPPSAWASTSPGAWCRQARARYGSPRADAGSRLLFLQGDAHALPLGATFDYVILSDLLGHVDDIQALLDGLHAVCTPRTRVLITYWNFLWHGAMVLAERLGLKMPEAQQNWLGMGDVDNLLTLTDFATLERGASLVCPKAGAARRARSSTGWPSGSPGCATWPWWGTGWCSPSPPPGGGRVAHLHRGRALPQRGGEHRRVHRADAPAGGGDGGDLRRRGLHRRHAGRESWSRSSATGEGWTSS